MQVGANTAICCGMKTWVEVELGAQKKNLLLNSHYAKIVEWVCVLHTKFPNGRHHSFNMLLFGYYTRCCLPDIAFVQPGCCGTYTVALCI